VGPYVSLAENIHRNRGTDDPVATALEGWWASPGHRANMLSADFDQTGIGVAVDRDGIFYLTQVFVQRPAVGAKAAAESQPDP
jgi:uncharacterized protein YkwD